MNTPIPVTILTGFLGSGKTTVLKHMLTQNHGRKIAIIENEFGSESIDHHILMRYEGEEVIQLNNGCICCTIRQDLQFTLRDLWAKKQQGTYDFEAVVIETTGLAEPTPIAQTFFLDEDLAKNYVLDSVVAVVDAKHTLAHLAVHDEVQKQIGFADLVLISKRDLVDEATLQTLKDVVHRMNLKAEIHVLNPGDIQLEHFFDRKGFHLDETVEKLFDDATNDQHTHDASCAPGCGHDHHHHHEAKHQHPHQLKVSSFSYVSEQAFDEKKLNVFFGHLLANYNQDLLRYKGVLYLKGVKEKLILQGIHELYATQPQGKWGKQKGKNQLVFIGMNLPKNAILEALHLCH